jgi:hypothetical protein
MGKRLVRLVVALVVAVAADDGMAVPMVPFVSVTRPPPLIRGGQSRQPSFPRWMHTSAQYRTSVYRVDNSSSDRPSTHTGRTTTLAVDRDLARLSTIQQTISSRVLMLHPYAYSKG